MVPYDIAQWNIRYDLGGSDEFYTKSGLSVWCDSHLNDTWFKKEEQSTRFSFINGGSAVLPQHISTAAVACVVIALEVAVALFVVSYFGVFAKASIFDKGQRDYKYGAVQTTTEDVTV